VSARRLPSRGRPARRDRHPVEVRPPERARDYDPERGGRHQADIEPEAGGADTDRHDRLAEGDDDDQREALDEVARGNVEAAHAEDEWAAVVDRKRRDPERRLHRPVEEAGGD
jgi:hypothetical protein